ncbi:MAG: GYF domain-containing protein [bacterium]
MTRYWLIDREGQTRGPLTLEELRAHAADGRMTPSSYVCPVGATEWKLVSELFPDFLGVVPPPPPRPPLRPSETGADRVGSAATMAPIEGARRVPLFWSIAATALTFCLSCFPTGAIAWYYAGRANKRYAAGDVEAGARAERTHWIWIAVSVVLAAVTAVLTVQLLDWVWNTLYGEISRLQRTIGLMR